MAWDLESNEERYCRGVLLKGVADSAGRGLRVRRVFSGISALPGRE
jgi:hypothetical protein